MCDALVQDEAWDIRIIHANANHKDTKDTKKHKACVVNYLSRLPDSQTPRLYQMNGTNRCVRVAYG